MPEIVEIKFGKNLVRLRRTRNMTQEELSHRTGITVKHISSLENGHREACLGTMVKLATALKIPVRDLLAGIGPQN